MNIHEPVCAGDYENNLSSTRYVSHHKFPAGTKQALFSS